MLRLLIIILSLLLLLALLKRLFSKELPERDEKHVAKMVQCDHCRIYIPHTTAIRHAKHYYCCEEHKEAASTNPP